jgi:hypothetical protein
MRERRGGVAAAAATAIAVGLLVVLTSSSAFAANDPHLLWRTLETPHFRINYYSTEDDVARHVATLVESIYARLVPAVGWAPSERTEIALTDQTDYANGSATALPYNAIQLFVTAPDDMSPLGDVDDWYLELVTHEYTHILHTDHIEGIPALVNRILGKTLAPNQVNPRWMLEGLAVFEESARTSGGRLRSSMWNMWMRADVLEHNEAPLDVFSNTPRRWPQGNIWYLYGSFFMQWIAETYGEQAIRGMIDDYARQIIPYAINRSIRRVTGRTFEDLYVAWMDSLERSFDAQARAIRARGIRDGVRVTHTGNTVDHPRWIPANAWSGHAGELAVYIDDGHTLGGYWALPLVRDDKGRVTGSRERSRDLLIRMNGPGGLSFMPDGAAVFSTQDIHDNLFLFDDLFELPTQRKSPSGLEGARVRWSDGWRALDPSVSPDGRRVVFTSNHRGTTRLMIADVVPSASTAGEHAVANARALAAGEEFDQAYTPRWAPDNRHVAYSSWARGGYRDVRIVDTFDGSVLDVTHDRAIDGDPAFSPDGRWLFFHSDRTGVMNVYAYEIATGQLRQVTNVVNGAYQPEPSPDGRSLAYLGYTHDGYDIFVMPLDPANWLDPLPYEETRPPAPPEPPTIPVVYKAYDPWLTMQPRAYSVQITPGLFGEESIVTVTGSDIAGQHGFTANLTTEWERPEIEGGISYTYSRLPFDVNASVYRQIAPSSYNLGSHTLPWVQTTVGASTGISYSIPRAFDAQSFGLQYSFSSITGKLQTPPSALNPYDTPSYPTRGLLGSLHLGWAYSNATGFLWSVGNEQGFDVSASVDLSEPWLASDFSGFAASLNFGTYLRMPWLEHHVLALHAGGGMSGGNAGGNGPFYVGGFQDIPVLTTIQNSLVQGGVALRGYPVVTEVGHYYGLFNAEYRFPIVNIDRGMSTLPLFLDRITGAAFADYGSAFDDPEQAKFKTGVGGELWFDVTLGYILDFTFRAGYARGLASGGIGKTYFVAVVPF